MKNYKVTMFNVVNGEPQYYSVIVACEDVATEIWLSQEYKNVYEIEPVEFVKVGDNRKEAYEDFCDFENGFDKDCRTEITFEEFCAELDKGYGKSGCIQVARLYEDANGVIWYDNDYVA